MRRIEPLTHFADLCHVLANLREADLRELEATSATGDPMQVGEQIVNGHPFAHVIYADGGEPVCVGGILPGWPGIGLLFAFATDRWPEVALTAFKFTRRFLLPAAMAHGVHRIECRVAADNTPAVQWIESLGGRREAVMPGFGRNREPFLLYSWISDNVRPAAALALVPVRRPRGGGDPKLDSRRIIGALFH